jgi:hypothetical protein
MLHLPLQVAILDIEGLISGAGLWSAPFVFLGNLDLQDQGQRQAGRSARSTRACSTRACSTLAKELRAQAQEFFSQVRVVLGQVQIAHFVGSGLSADDFGGGFLLVWRPAVEIRDQGED